MSRDGEERLELYVPKVDDLWFRQRMLEDPATMAYNAHLDLDMDGYRRETGCIDFPRAKWAAWHARWIGREPERFYAYVRRCADGAWLGEVCFYRVPQRDWWDMGIVLYAPHRGKGYADAAVRLMLAHAFLDCGVNRIHNHFEIDRPAATPLHAAAGFRETAVEGGIRHVVLTREDYLRQRRG